MQMLPYLLFRGDAAQALDFYTAAELGAVIYAIRYKDSPPAFQPPADWDDKIINAEFVGDGVRFMASDAPKAEPMKGVALSIAIADLDEAERLFAVLGKGGQVTMAVHRTFWGADFGTFTDKFGVQWMINCETAESQANPAVRQTPASRNAARRARV